MTLQSSLVATFVQLNAGSPRHPVLQPGSIQAGSWMDAGQTSQRASLEERYSLRGLWSARPRWRPSQA